MSVPVSDLVSAISEVGQLIGHDLLPLFQQRIPALNTAALPNASGDMRTAREHRLAELGADDPKSSNR